MNYSSTTKIPLKSATATAIYNGELYIHKETKIHKLKNGAFKPAKAKQP
jgi:hypothetical protein